MNIAGFGHFSASLSAPAPMRESLRSVSAESQLGLASPVARPTKLTSTSTSTSEAKTTPEQRAGAKSADQSASIAAQERLKNLELAQLSSRDREVRAHEQAHSSVGGSYAGSASYTFKRGPDGRSYAVGGEVGIDLAAIANNPAATARKMEQVQRAALAPADPSDQDISVAARAQGLAAQARVELAAQQRDAVEGTIAERKAQAVERAQAEQDKSAENQQSASASIKTAQQDFNLTPSLQLYRSIGALPEASALLDVVS